MHDDLTPFIDSQGRITTWPAKQAKRALVLQYLITKFDFDRTYSEAEVNTVLKQWHTFEDWSLLRRELYDAGYVDRTRDGTVYQRLL